MNKSTNKSLKQTGDTIAEAETPRPFFARETAGGVRLINVGFGNIVGAARIVAIVNPDSAPVKRICAEAKERGRLIDATQGRRKRAAIICDSNHIILSALQPETVAGRVLNDE